MASISRTAGYLLIDNSNSPGIPEDLAAKWAKQGTVVAPGSTKLEAATYTCPHCNAIIVIRPERTRPREICRKCMAIVCDRASCVLECQPFDKLVDLVLAGRTVTLDPVTNLILPALHS